MMHSVQFNLWNASQDYLGQDFVTPYYVRSDTWTELCLSDTLMVPPGSCSRR